MPTESQCGVGGVGGPDCHDLQVIAYTAVSSAPAEDVWPLLAQPARWRRWVPHLREAVGLGRPEVEPGRRGLVIAAPGLLVPVRVLDKVPGRCWTCSVGPLRLGHAVTPAKGGGREVRVELRGPLWLEVLVGATYGPLIRLLLANLVRVAGRRSPLDTAASARS